MGEQGGVAAPARARRAAVAVARVLSVLIHPAPLAPLHHGPPVTCVFYLEADNHDAEPLKSCSPFVGPEFQIPAGTP
jgi:hypothetical protein